jgi:hypothetical protein
MAGEPKITTILHSVLSEHDHEHVRGASTSDDGQTDHVGEDCLDDGSGDVGEKRPGMTQQADHFRCVHRKKSSTNLLKVYF